MDEFAGKARENSTEVKQNTFFSLVFFFHSAKMDEHKTQRLVVCVAVDGSENSFRALERGLNLVVNRGHHDRLVLLMVRSLYIFFEGKDDCIHLLVLV